MGRRRILALGAASLLMLGGCRRREPLETARARAGAVFLKEQIDGLQELVRRAEAGELTTRDQLAIGISEGVAKELIDASLPQEAVVAGRLRVRIESATPIFRGTKAALVFQARVSGVRATGVSASVELGGGLEEFRLLEGRLLAKVELTHFSVLEASAGELAADVLDNLIKGNLGALQAAIPEVQIPVHLEQNIKIDGLAEGAVVVKPGSLPLEVSVAHVIPVNERLWVLIDARAGPWRRAEASE